MTDPTIAFSEYLINIGLNKDADFLQEGIQLLSQMLMELEVEEKTGAKKHERTPERKNHRNGYRTRTWETRVGEIELRIPKLLQRNLLSQFAGAPKTGRESPPGGCAASLLERREHPQGGCACESAGIDRD